MIEYFSEIKKFQKKSKIKTPIGCSSSDIEELEQRLGMPLPLAYKEYLLWMGNDYEGVLVGSNCFIDDVEENNDSLPGLLAENKVKYKLQEKYLCFFSHQGYSMAWFNMPYVNEDPVVFLYSEGTTKEPIESGTFSQYMTQDLLTMSKTRVELSDKKKWWQFWN